YELGTGNVASPESSPEGEVQRSSGGLGSGVVGGSATARSSSVPPDFISESARHSGAGLVQLPQSTGQVDALRSRSAIPNPLLAQSEPANLSRLAGRLGGPKSASTPTSIRLPVRGEGTARDFPSFNSLSSSAGGDDYDRTSSSFQSSQPKSPSVALHAPPVAQPWRQRPVGDHARVRGKGNVVVNRFSGSVQSMLAAPPVHNDPPGQTFSAAPKAKVGSSALNLESETNQDNEEEDVSKKSGIEELQAQAEP
ncbi:unnamed protein product, partial [Amoebophrya sp. A120]